MDASVVDVCGRHVCMCMCMCMRMCCFVYLQKKQGAQATTNQGNALYNSVAFATNAYTNVVVMNYMLLRVFVFVGVWVWV